MPSTCDELTTMKEWIEEYFGQEISDPLDEAGEAIRLVLMRLGVMDALRKTHRRLAQLDTWWGNAQRGNATRDATIAARRGVVTRQKNERLRAMTTLRKWIENLRGIYGENDRVVGLREALELIEKRGKV